MAMVKSYHWSYCPTRTANWRRRQLLDQSERMTVIAKISQVFRPGTPIDKYDLFAGRGGQVRDIIRSVNQPGQHVIMYGERGVGKTSLSRILVELLTSLNIDVVSPESINCDGTDNFSSIWHKVFREMSYATSVEKMGFRPNADSRNVSLDNLLPETATPDDIRFVLNRLPMKSIIIIDEVDRIKTQETTTLLADTIKSLSDHAVPTTLILIGVADSVDELIAEHHSIERALVQVHMPRMSPEELYQILDKGKEIGIKFSDDARRYIVKLSAGLPHYTHTLGLFAAEEAVSDGRLDVMMNDVNRAVQMTANKSGSILSNYHKATSSPRRETLYTQVLLACALADKDALGYFTAASVRTPLGLLMGKRYEIPAFSGHLDDFCSDKRGHILEKQGTKRQFRFRFVNPLMQPFVIIHGISEGLLNAETLIMPSPEIMDV